MNASDRQASVEIFYGFLDELRDRCGGYRILASANGRTGWPRHGVYFFFENGEQRTPGTPRVVRVGTHALTSTSKTTLWQRLSGHRGNVGGRNPGGGNHRGSIFRLHVGTALLNRGEHPEAAATWGARNAALPDAREREGALERAVSAYIGRMPLLWLEVPNRQERGMIERNAIALLSNLGRASVDPASQGWLGHHADRQTVRDSHLWNVNHVADSCDTTFLDVMASCVREQPPVA